MAANIQVDYEVLKTKGEEMKTAAETLRETVDAIQTEVKKIRDDGGYVSDASENMYDFMTDLTSTFQRFEDVIREYSQFLTDAYNKYKDTEDDLRAESSKLDFV